MLHHSTRTQSLEGFGHWIQLVCCTYLLTCAQRHPVLEQSAQQNSHSPQTSGFQGYGSYLAPHNLIPLSYCKDLIEASPDIVIKVHNIDACLLSSTEYMAMSCVWPSTCVLAKVQGVAEVAEVCAA